MPDSAIPIGQKEVRSGGEAMIPGSLLLHGSAQNGSRRMPGCGFGINSACKIPDCFPQGSGILPMEWESPENPVKSRVSGLSDGAGGGVEPARVISPLDFEGVTSFGS